MRNEYIVKIRLNRRTFNRVVIDDHYSIKHSRVMSDALILRLCKSLDGEVLDYKSVTREGWQIMVKDPLFFEDKLYRVVLCTHPDEKYIGVINAFRRTDG